MLEKSEKKYILLKILVAILVIFFIAMAFIHPKPRVEQIEKAYTVQENV